MEFGADFDDDFFEEPKERQLNGPAKYEPKVFKPLWFMDTDSSQKSDEESALHALKHQADHHYARKSYPQAAETYERCLGMVPPGTNATWRREFMENIARSHLNMGQPEKALEWSFELDKSSCNADQKIVSMNLLAAVCHKLKKYAASARKPGDNIVAVAGPSKVSKSSKKEELSSKSVGYPAKTDSTSGESASEGSESDDDSNAESDDDTSEDIRVANEEMKIIRRNEEVQVSIGRRPPRGLLEISKTGALKFDSFPEDSEEETSD